MTGIVRHIKTNVLYRHIGGNKFRNLITGKEGEVAEETAREIFKINVEATMIINEFPEVENLIRTLNLRLDV